MAEQSLLSLLRRALELAMPDLRAYYRMTRKAKVVAAYASDGAIMRTCSRSGTTKARTRRSRSFPGWKSLSCGAGPKRGIICPPAAGTLCDLSYYDGDPNYPRISNFRWQGNAAPDCGLDELVIQQTPGVSLKIEKDGSFLTVSPENWTVEVGGNAVIKAEGNATVEAAGTLTLQAPNIIKNGNETCAGKDGGTGTTTRMPTGPPTAASRSTGRSQ